MTKKDYEAIATAIDGSRWPEEDKSDRVTVVARNIADAMQADNPRFDRARFLSACGVA